MLLVFIVFMVIVFILFLASLKVRDIFIAKGFYGAACNLIAAAVFVLGMYGLIYLFAFLGHK